MDLSTPQKVLDGSCSHSAIMILEEEYLSNSDCAICLSSFEDDELCDVVTTRCRHKFHCSCLLQSKLKGKIECPMCRAKLTPPHQSTIESILGANDGPSQSLIRETIIQASRRGREAVRLALARSNRSTNTIRTGVSVAS